MVKISLSITIMLFLSIFECYHQAVIKNERIEQNGSQRLQKLVNSINNDTNQQQDNQEYEIYGIRWFIGDYFAYENLFKLQEQYKNHRELPLNSNYYILAFNSQSKFQEDVYVQILSTAYTCSHRLIQVDATYDHQSVELSPNETNWDSTSNIYKCYINVDLSGFWKQAYVEGLVNDSKNASIWKQYPYSIYIQEPQFMHTNQQRNLQPNKIYRIVQTKKIILFEGKFRAPIPVYPKTNEQKQDTKLMQQNVLVMGDWGIISPQIQKTQNYIPILQSVLTKIEQDQNIVLVLFLGDLAYDFVGKKYGQMLKYLQPLLSRICFMVSPGNHDYIYHQDSFQLFGETFLSPLWRKYYNFYFTFILGDVLFISYSPQIQLNDYNIQTNIKVLMEMKNDLYNHYIEKKNIQNQSNNNNQVDPINKQYHVIVFTHYPIFCSKTNDDLQSCQNNKYHLQQYLKIFSDIGMDLYFSGHVHYYERTQSICWDSNKLVETVKKYQNVQNGYQFYTTDCPIYIVEGTAGNDYFQQEEGAITPTQITSKIGFNTGFGVLSIQTQLINTTNQTKQSKQNQFVYTHYKMKQINKTMIYDKFIKKLPILSKYLQSPIEQNDSIYVDNDPMSVRMLQILGIILLIVLISIGCFVYGKKYIGDFEMIVQRKKKQNAHVQMVQDNAHSDLQENKNHINQQKNNIGFD